MLNVEGLYLITVQDGDSLPFYYVGQSNCIRKRWACHKSALRHGKHRNERMQRMFNLHGLGCFSIQVLQICEPDQIDAEEQWWLDLMHGSDRCLNIASDAVSTAKGATFSLERRRKIGDKKRGVALSSEVRARMSASHAGKKLSDSHRAAVSAGKMGAKHPMYGKSLSEQRRAQLRDAFISSDFFRNSMRPVSMLDMHGNQLCEYASMSLAEADGFMVSHISQCCSGKRKSHGGYRWKHLVTTQDRA